MINHKIVCPLGNECEAVIDDEIVRCAWYVRMTGVTPDGKDLDEWRCAMSWMPIIMLENAQTNRGQTAALESFRNETKRGQDKFNGLLESAMNKRYEELEDGTV